MKKNNFFLKLIIIMFFIISGKTFASEISIKYIVEDKTITNVDIKNEINYLLLVNSKLSELNEEILVEYATKSLLREKIKEIELTRNFSFGQNDIIINEQINILKGNLNIIDDQFFSDLLSELNLSEKFVYKKMEIEILWNKLIYERFIDQIFVDQNKIRNDLQIRIESSTDEINEYLIYEILYSANKKNELEELYDKIKLSVSEIGFENTASLYSIANSSKLGGKIGWINENQLSQKVLEEIKNLENFEFTQPVNTPNGMLILMTKDRRKISKKINFNDELQKMINQEANKQLEQFSQIFFKKIELNTKIYEK